MRTYAYLHVWVMRLMASQGSSDSSFEKASMIRGHHIYKSIWTPVVGEELTLQQEDGNDHDIHAVAVVGDGDVVGHVPRSISRVSWFFLVRGGRIKCRVTGRRKFGNGLEVPCVYSYYGSARTIQKLSRLLEDSGTTESLCHFPVHIEACMNHEYN